MEVVFRPNENLCLLAALWGVTNGEQKQLMTNGGETNVKDMFKHSMGKGKGKRNWYAGARKQRVKWLLVHVLYSIYLS